ncbi:hypothetical protein ARMGADRAFT_1037218 [Armillaria gallica]|uniref:Uncharacterized protein n=1 Tax=Armillaria gallica TaxID=47427 RepID=A0A2H3D7H7_ARMGA|nr:hypothetical protein ARMGADRAFT_1037218 [Armillaria gallica]
MALQTETEPPRDLKMFMPSDDNSDMSRLWKEYELELNREGMDEEDSHSTLMRGQFYCSNDIPALNFQTGRPLSSLVTTAPGLHSVIKKEVDTTSKLQHFFALPSMLKTLTDEGQKNLGASEVGSHLGAMEGWQTVVLMSESLVNWYPLNPFSSMAPKPKPALKQSASTFNPSVAKNIPYKTSGSGTDFFGGFSIPSPEDPPPIFPDENPDDEFGWLFRDEERRSHILSYVDLKENVQDWEDVQDPPRDT